VKLLLLLSALLLQQPQTQPGGIVRGRVIFRDVPGRNPLTPDIPLIVTTAE
jgi:hypothetical protein